ncbi:pre-peptidase C-terminal domain-containing protein [Portibacter marinus]|uniref:pre-peptidase C-terminal domain-containing protein n=1 Tax=Portibacter marinus TaxID=2898660 RepID=UPI001F258AD2|nr:pre-peptidase C-terminal domain-containing protein [Portibacter marinus]
MKKFFTLLVCLCLSISLFSQFNCATATELWCGETIAGNNYQNCYNTVSEGYCGTDHDEYTGREKIYSFEVKGSAKTIKILLANLTADLDMFLLRSCSPADCVAKSTHSSNYNYEYISVTLDPGVYYIVIDGWAGATSNFYLKLDCVDNSGELECVDAQTISCGQSISDNTSTGSNNTDGLYCNAHGSYNGKEKVYELNLTSTKEVTIIASGLSADLDMFLLNACDRKTCVAVSGKGSTNSEVIRKTLPAGDYYIVLDGYQGVQSPFTLSVNCDGYETVDCDDLVTSYYSGNGSNLKFNYKFNAQSNLEFVAWKVNGNTLATAPHVQFIFPSAGTYNVCAVYKNKSTGQTFTCCKKACISVPTTCEDIISYQYVNGIYKLTMNTNMADVTNVSWRNDTDGVGIDPNNMPASCRTLTISVRYYSTASQCWVVCCRTITFCPPSSCQDAITSSYDASSNTYKFDFVHPSATHLRWKFDETGEVLPDGEFTLPQNWTCKNRTATVYYYDTYLKTWKACCKKFNLCPPQSCDGTIDYDYIADGNKFKFTLNVQGATDAEWSFVEDGTELPDGVFELPDDWTCKDRTVKVAYYDPDYQTWRVCTKRFSICPPDNCGEAIQSDYDESTRTFTFSLDLEGASNFYWRFDEGNVHLPGGKFKIPTGWKCQIFTVSVFWYDSISGCWRVCCKKFNICPPMDCDDNQPTSSFTTDIDGSSVDFTNTSTDFDSVSWDYDGGVANSEGGFTYAPGTYEVCLTVFNDCGSDQSCNQFTIEEEEEESNALLFKIDSIACRTAGTEVIIDVTTRNFEDILTFNFTIQASDSTDIKIKGIESLNPLFESGSNRVVRSDQVRFFWSHTEGQNLEDDALMFRIRILLVNATANPISLKFVDEPVATEAFNGDLEEVDLKTEDGSVCAREAAGLVNIGGKIVTPDSQRPVAKVKVEAISGETDEMITGTDGTFMIEELNFGENYVLRPTKNSDPNNGLNALDIVTLQRHILQISTLDSPYSLIAADVNNDQVINAIDVVLMQRMHLRVIDAYPNNTSWRFIPQSYQFTTDHPLTENYPTEITYNGIDGDYMNENFYGIKIGDLNQSSDPLRSAPGDTLELTIDRVFASSSDQVMINVRANGWEQLSILEGTIQWDSLGLEFVSVGNYGVENFTDDNFGRPSGSKDKLTFYWTEPRNEGQTVPDSTIIFTLTFDVIGDVETEAAVTFADSPLDVSAADNDLEAVTVVENDGQVAILAPLNVQANVKDVSCKFGDDGFIALDVSGATNNYSYLWSNDATTDSIGGLGEGTYAFTVTDIFSGLTVEDSISLISPNQLTIELKDVTSDPDSLATVETSVSGGIPPYAYLWSTGATTDSLINVENGTYDVTVTDQNGCEVRGSIEVDIMSVSIPVIDVIGFNVFPNPTVDKINVTIEEGLDSNIKSWTIFNVLGEKVNEGTLTKDVKTFDIKLGGHSPGLYYLKLGDHSVPILLIR